MERRDFLKTIFGGFFALLAGLPLLSWFVKPSYGYTGQVELIYCDDHMVFDGVEFVGNTFGFEDGDVVTITYNDSLDGEIYYYIDGKFIPCPKRN
jgi:hypothetical protein